MQQNIQLSRTQPFRPSKIGLFCSCPLRYIFETERPEPGGLPPGPQVYLGIAFHGAIENFWGQPSIKGIDIRQWIREKFGKKIATENKGLCKWLYGREGIDSLIAPSLVSDASRLAQQQVAASGHAIFKGASTFKDKSQGILGIERRLSSNALDLDGRADLIERDGECISVVDFKLGLQFTESGEPKIEYLLQLAAYALIVKEELGNVKVNLELRSPKKSSKLEFDSSLEAILLKTIQDMHTTLPRLKALDASEIAQKGEHCLSCGYRSMCTDYLTRLSSSFTIDDDFVSPLDISGTVINVSENDGIVSVLLSAKPDFRRVLISGIPVGLLSSQLNPGDDFAAFSLRTPEAQGKGNYIANFHLFDSVNPRQSAFSCKILVGTSLTAQVVR